VSEYRQPASIHTALYNSSCSIATEVSFNYDNVTFVLLFTCIPTLISLSLPLWLYSPLDFGRFFNFLIYIRLVGLLGRGISKSQDRFLHTDQHKHRINADRHPCLEWDSNLRSRCSSERRRFIPGGHCDRRGFLYTRLFITEMKWRFCFWLKIMLADIEKMYQCSFCQNSLVEFDWT
jgi:hypothetical protein